MFCHFRLRLETDILDKTPETEDAGSSPPESLHFEDRESLFEACTYSNNTPPCFFRFQKEPCPLNHCKIRARYQSHPHMQISNFKALSITAPPKALQAAATSGPGSIGVANLLGDTGDITIPGKFGDQEGSLQTKLHRKGRI